MLQSAIFCLKELLYLFKNIHPWPEADDIAPYMSVDDPVFLNLYRELCFRHIYARVPGGPTIHQRFESYYNYCQVRDKILFACTVLTTTTASCSTTSWALRSQSTWSCPTSGCGRWSMSSSTSFRWVEWIIGWKIKRKARLISKKWQAFFLIFS